MFDSYNLLCFNKAKKGARHGYQTLLHSCHVNYGDGCLIPRWLQYWPPEYEKILGLPASLGSDRGGSCRFLESSIPRLFAEKVHSLWCDFEGFHTHRGAILIMSRQKGRMGVLTPFLFGQVLFTAFQHSQECWNAVILRLEVRTAQVLCYNIR